MVGTVGRNAHGRLLPATVRNTLTGNEPLILFHGPEEPRLEVVTPESFFAYNRGDDPIVLEFTLHVDSPFPDLLIARQTVMPGQSLSWLKERGFAMTGGDEEIGPPDDAGFPMVWGASNVAAGADTRYLVPGYTNNQAGTSPLPLSMPRGGTLGRIHVRHNNASGNGNPVQYVVRVNDTDTALTVSLPTGAIGQAAFDVNVPVVKGDRVAVKAVKASGIGSGGVEVLATVLLYPPNMNMLISGPAGADGDDGAPGAPGADGANANIRVYMDLSIHADSAAGFGPGQSYRAPAPISGTIIQVGGIVEIGVEHASPMHFFNNSPPSFPLISSTITMLPSDGPGTLKVSGPVSVPVAKDDMLYVAFNGFPGSQPTYGRVRAFFDIQPA